jgi:hypothetical protein
VSPRKFTWCWERLAEGESPGWTHQLRVQKDHTLVGRSAPAHLNKVSKQVSAGLSWSSSKLAACYNSSLLNSKFLKQPTQSRLNKSSRAPKYPACYMKVTWRVEKSGKVTLSKGRNWLRIRRRDA